MKKRVIAGALLIFVWTHLGAAGYYYLLDREASFALCLYRTFILISTVNEPWPESKMSALPEDTAYAVERYSVLVLAVGMGLLLYTVSQLAALIIEGDLGGGIRRRRLQRMIEALDSHTIVCGGGETGRILIAELERLGEPYCVVEIDPGACERLRDAGHEPVLEGDAASDDVLRTAGIERARGVIAALPNDKDNLFVVVSARQFSPTLKIVSRCDDDRTHSKLQAAGANAVVLQNHIAAGRMVGAMVRPTVVEFVDQVLRDPRSNDRLEEVEVGPKSMLAGRTLAACDIRESHGVSVLGVRQVSESHFRCNPSPEERVEAGTALVVLGPVDRVPGFVEIASGRRASEAERRS